MKTNPKPLLVSAVALFLSLSASNAAEQANNWDNAPNVVFILADDMGVGDVSHNGGLAPTPHIDRMAKEGLRFTDAHSTSSVCTPTRYSILTGRYNWRSPLKKSVVWGFSDPLIPESRLTVPAYLKSKGYHTGIVGKWHLGLGWHKLPNGEVRQPAEGPAKGEGWDVDFTRKVDGGPLALGFDESFIISASLDMTPFVYLRNDLPVGVPTVTKHFYRWGMATEDFEAVNCLSDFAREARSFISAQVARDAQQPFFLYLSLTSPHTPIVPSPEWQGKSPLGDYGDFLMETDWVVGEVIAELEKQGIAENTLVIFSADNGCSPEADIDKLKAKGHQPNGPLRGHKADVFEGGHRVPFVVRWPQRVAAGGVCAQTVSSVDLFRTLADVLGEADSLPDEAAEDSFSLLPLLDDPTVSEPVRPFIIHHSGIGYFAIREGKWKLLLCPGSGGWSEPRPKDAEKDLSLPAVQLYDLQSDLAESRNLIEEHPEVAARLVAKLAKAIRDGRTTQGKAQSNEGYPDTFIGRVKECYPQLNPHPLTACPPKL